MDTAPRPTDSDILAERERIFELLFDKAVPMGGENIDGEPTRMVVRIRVKELAEMLGLDR